MPSALSYTLTLICLFGVPSFVDAATVDSPIYAIRAQTIEGQSVTLDKFRGKVILVANTASKCGFTPQYEGLEALYSKFKDRGFVVLGFPSNDFGGQEPGTNEEVVRFCKLRYGVTFPLFAKGSVSGEAIQPLFRTLTEQSSEELRGEVAWNFEKFLIDRSGKLRMRFRSRVKPLDESVTDAIQTLLDEKGVR